MDKFEFKINYYFNMYKDEPLRNAKDFKTKFIKKHGNFQYLNEVILRISRYQVKKYGNGLRFNDYITEDEKRRLRQNARTRVNKEKHYRSGK